MKPKTYRSKKNPNRCWKMFTPYPGFRDVYHYFNGESSRVFFLQTRKTYENVPGKGWKTVVKWVAFQADNGMRLGESRSPESLVKQLVQNL